MTNYHKIPKAVTAARHSDPVFSDGLLSADTEPEHPEEPLLDAARKLGTVWETVIDLTAVHENCIAFEDSQLDGQELFELCCDLEMVDETMTNTRAEDSPYDDLYPRVESSRHIARSQVDMYANLLDLRTRTEPVHDSTAPGNYYTSRYHGVEAERIKRAVAAARCTLDMLKDTDDQTLLAKIQRHIDDIVDECTIISQLEITSQDRYDAVKVSSESYHVGYAESAMAPNRQSSLLQRLRNTIEEPPSIKALLAGDSPR